MKITARAATLAGLFALAALGTAHTSADAKPVAHFSDQDRRQVEDVFLQQAQAATAHDIRAFGAVLADAAPGLPDPVVFVARAYQFWGKPALVDHFRETFKGVWKFEPDRAHITIVPLTTDVAQIYAPTQITLGKSAATAKTVPFLVYETAVRTPSGWRVASIVPVPAN
ncbi:DUF4440 domain-containing protein [Bordetella flabilis]|uniref:DUF4440 domain-containing protein n=2 Tax=Bordetella flabilis TaxID=463014 RepID=A0A193GMY5_9BORD|nr:DUF4440 domain-containing protein [Bordetella flabilis]